MKAPPEAVASPVATVRADLAGVPGVCAARLVPGLNPESSGSVPQAFSPSLLRGVFAEQSVQQGPTQHNDGIEA